MRSVCLNVSNKTDIFEVYSTAQMTPSKSLKTFVCLVDAAILFNRVYGNQFVTNLFAHNVVVWRHLKTYAVYSAALYPTKHTFCTVFFLVYAKIRRGLLLTKWVCCCFCVDVLRSWVLQMALHRHVKK